VLKTSGLIPSCYIGSRRGRWLVEEWGIGSQGKVGEWIIGERASGSGGVGQRVVGERASGSGGVGQRVVGERASGSGGVRQWVAGENGTGGRRSWRSREARDARCGASRGARAYGAARSRGGVDSPSDGSTAGCVGW
jgi:hypothetical protein